MQHLIQTTHWTRAYLAHALAHTTSLLRRYLVLAPPTPARCVLSREWMTQQLHAHAVIPTHIIVAQVEVTHFDAAGFAGQMRRIKVTYVDQRTNEETTAYPPSFVLKMSADSVATRRVTILYNLYREAFFYNHPYSRSHPNVPRVIYSYGSQFYGEYLMIMEDLSIRKPFTKVNFVFGNQIWGITDGVATPTEDPVETLKNMFLQAANQHAKFWENEQILQQSWLKASQWYNGKGRTQWEVGMTQARDAWAKVKGKIGDGSIGFEFSEKLYKIIDKSISNSSWEGLQTFLNDPKIPWSLCHGDFHASNMLLVDERLFWVDWCQVGPWEPTGDLAQTIISDVKPDIFEKHSRALVRAYWEHLCEQGVDNPFSPILSPSPILCPSPLLCPSLPFSPLLSPPLPFSPLLSRSLAFSRLLSPSLAFSRLLSPSLAFSRLLSHSLPFSPILSHSLPSSPLLISLLPSDFIPFFSFAS